MVCQQCHNLSLSCSKLDIFLINYLACFSAPSGIASARLKAAFTSFTRATCASVPVPAAARLARNRRANAGVSLSSEFWVWGSRWSSTKARTLQSFQIQGQNGVSIIHKVIQLKITCAWTRVYQPSDAKGNNKR